MLPSRFGRSLLLSSSSSFKLSSSLWSVWLSRSYLTGSVAWFNAAKGFGFITTDETPPRSLFAHQSAVNGSGFRFLLEGERVRFDIAETPRGVAAANISNAEGFPFDRDPSVRPPPSKGRRMRDSPRSFTVPGSNNNGSSASFAAAAAAGAGGAAAPDRHPAYGAGDREWDQDGNAEEEVPVEELDLDEHDHHDLDDVPSRRRH